MDYLEIGPTPAYENCEQLGPNYNPERAKQECREFLQDIRDALGPEPLGTRLCVRSNIHDFGIYYEVAVKYEDDIPEAFEYALKVESEAPIKWSERAKKVLGL